MDTKRKGENLDDTGGMMEIMFLFCSSYFWETKCCAILWILWCWVTDLSALKVTQFVIIWLLFWCKLFASDTLQLKSLWRSWYWVAVRCTAPCQKTQMCQLWQLMPCTVRWTMHQIFQPLHQLLQTDMYLHHSGSSTVINLSTSFLVGDKVKFWFPCNHCVLVVRCCSWFCLYVPGVPWAISFLWNFVSQ